MFFSLGLILFSCSRKTSETGASKAGNDWENLFNAELSDADFPEGIWSVENGELTATEDQAIWSVEQFDDFILDLEFKNAAGTNSGVIVYCTDKDDWIPNSVEIQIADDYDPKWANAAKDWQCGAIFGHLPATRQKVVRKPGAWNRMTITCVGQRITVVLNDEPVTDMDMSKWTSATRNPDGSPIPEWLNHPFAELETKGYIGLQGKHAGAPVWFRNIRVKRLN